MDYKYYVTKINKLKFKDLPIEECGDVFIGPILQTWYLNVWKNLLRVIKHTFIRDVKVEDHSIECPVAMVFSNSYSERSDHRTLFNKVQSLVDDKVVYSPGNSFTFCNVKYLPLLFSWQKALKKEFNNKEAFFFATQLYMAYLDAIYILSDIKERGISHVFTFCDHQIIDSLIVHLLKGSGVSTSTLQHGYYEKYSYAYDYSRSDYFLCYGQSSIDNAKGTGVQGDFVTLGMPHLIGKNVNNDIKVNNTRKFAVILGLSDVRIPDEIDVLKMSEKLVSEYEYSRIIKLHPGSDTSRYDYEWLQSDEIVSSGITVADLESVCDFALIPSGSTVYIEYLLDLFPAFLYKGHFEYYAESEPLKFKDQKEMMDLYSMLMSDPGILQNHMKEIRTYHTVTDHVSDNYAAFFKEIARKNRIGLN